MIETREEYDYVVKRGYEPLVDDRFPMEHRLRVEIQREKFGKNNAEGNRKFYKFCLLHYPHICENCGKPIENPWAMNVSHILSRGSHPEMAFDPRNVNILCAGCHAAWEHATTRYHLRMWFVEKNERTIEQLKQEYQ